MANILSPDMGTCQPLSASLRPPFELVSKRLGPLPLANELIGQLELPWLLDRYVPTTAVGCPTARPWACCCAPS